MASEVGPMYWGGATFSSAGVRRTPLCRDGLRLGAARSYTLCANTLWALSMGRSGRGLRYPPWRGQ